MNELLLPILLAVVAFVAGYLVGKSRKNASANDQNQLLDNYVSRDLHERELQNVGELKEENRRLNEHHLRIQTEMAAKVQEFVEIKRRMEEYNTEMNRLREEFSRQFKLTATEILEQNSDAFRKQTGEQMHHLLNPLKEKINSFEKKVEETFQKGQSETIQLKTEVRLLVEQNEHLRIEANNLTRALKGEVKTQGTWGEVILEKLLERSGLRKGIEYNTQEHYKDKDSGKTYIPDAVIHLPDDKYVIIDSKVSLVHYERMSAAETREDEAAQLKLHTESIRRHVKGLGEKDYPRLLGNKSPDFVLLFIPIEGAFSAALQADHNLYQYAYERNIIIVTTSTLMATLQMISAIWKQENTNRNAQEISKRGKLLYEKFKDFVDDMLKLGDQIRRAESTYNDALNKLKTGRGNLVGQAEKLRQLGIKSNKRIDAEMRNEADDLLPESENDTEE